MALSQAPDLTAPGAIAALKADSKASPVYGRTYNLGATGLRGWIHIVKNNNIAINGELTKQSRQILVTTASAPADTVLAVDDVILGAIAGNSGAVPLFTSDCRKAFAEALSNAEKTGGGTLRVKRWRAGVTTDVNIPITIMGNYTATAPYNCPKSTLILDQSRNQMVAELMADANYFKSGSLLVRTINALALLASVGPTDPNYTEVQDRIRTFARTTADRGPSVGSLVIWEWAYVTLFLSEYYLYTGDARVINGLNQFNGIKAFLLRLSAAQNLTGTFGHDPGYIWEDGSGRVTGTGYGSVTSVSTVANLAILLGKKALETAGETIDPSITTAIQRGSDHYAWYRNKGSLPYGENLPAMANTSNGKDATAAVFFGLQSGRTEEAKYFTRRNIASFNGREFGHTGQGFSYLWGAMGAHVGGAYALAEYIKPITWHLDLSRRTDGTFVYDGRIGGYNFGAGTTIGGTYFGDSSYYGINPAASYLLTYALPLKRLYITGKDANPLNELTTDEVNDSIQASSFERNRPNLSNAELIDFLDNYDPVTRFFATAALQGRIVNASQLTTLRTMLTSADANERSEACLVLGAHQDLAALPTIVGLVSDPEYWVRAQAAVALSLYERADVATYRDTLLTAYINNALNSNVINWVDPFQTANGRLCNLLFYKRSNETDISPQVANAPKNLLYPAIRIALKQPYADTRASATRFCYERLGLTDVQVLAGEIAEAAEQQCLANQRRSPLTRKYAIQALAKHKIRETVTVATNMLHVPPGLEWGAPTFLTDALNALAEYGDAARWTLPRLRSYLGGTHPTSNQNATLINTIDTIENAITAPIQNDGFAVAYSQSIATTGPVTIKLTGSSPRGSVSFTEISAPLHGTITGAAPDLTYTPNPGYTGPDLITFKAVDETTTSELAGISIIVGNGGTGLQGSYYNNANFTGPAVTRVDPELNFDWGAESPDASIAPDNFSAVWNGLLLVPETTTYTFSTLNSDGVILYLDGVPVINTFENQDTRWNDGIPVNLVKGQLVEVQMRYFENQGSAVAKLKWTGPTIAGRNGSIISSQWLFDGGGMAGRTTHAHSQSVNVLQNTPQAIQLTGSGGNLVYTVSSPPNHGSLTGTPPNLIYTPVPGYTGLDSFSFTVNNGGLESAPATVSIGIQSALLETFTWQNAISGNWSVASNWSPTSPTTLGNSNYKLNFAPDGDYTATHNLSDGFLLNQLGFNGPANINGTASIAFAPNGVDLPLVDQNGSSVAVINTPIRLDAMTRFNSSTLGQVRLSYPISGSGGILKEGDGRLNIQGAETPNPFSGGTVINGGILKSGDLQGQSIRMIDPLGSGTITLNSGQLQLIRVDFFNALDVNGGSILNLDNSTSYWKGSVQLNSDLTCEGDYNITIDGNMTGPGGLIKHGNSSLRLNGNNTFSGNVKVENGTLICGSSTSLGPGRLEINNGARVNLSYSGDQIISLLSFDGGEPLPPGTYGSSRSPATFKSDIYFSGNGTVTVLAVPVEQTVSVPNLVSLSQATALADLTTAGLNAGNLVLINSDTIPAGNIISQSPIAGTTVEIGSAVDIVISMGVVNLAPIVDAGDNQTLVLTDNSTPWTPVEIATAAWFDAADTSSITHAGGIVTQWSDKSGNNRHAVEEPGQNTPKTGLATMNGKNVLTFNSDRLNFPALSASDGAWSYIGVINLTKTPAVAWDSVLSHADGNVAGSIQIDIRDLTNPSSSSFGLTIRDNNEISHTLHESGSFRNPYSPGSALISSVFSNTDIRSYSNGNHVATFGQQATSARDNSMYFGVNRAGTHYLDANHAEWVFFDSAINETDRQNLEGYLAHKWGITGELPPNHPHKFIPPGAPTIDLNIEGTVSDPDSPTLNTTWSLYSGPGQVAFADANSLSTTISFSVVGTYIIRLTANDGTHTVINDITVTVRIPSIANAGEDQAVVLQQQLAPWTPVEIATAAWFDAADTSSITHAGGIVTQWSDKSGNNRHAVEEPGQNTPKTGLATMNGKNVLTFNSDRLNFPALSASDGAWSYIGVINLTKTPAVAWDSVLSHADGNVAGSIQIDIRDLTNPSSSSFGLTIRDNNEISHTLHESGSFRNPYSPGSALISSVFSNTDIRSYSNGNHVATFGQQATSARDNSMYFGVNRAGTHYLDANHAEWVFFDSAINETDRQNLEGYLAHKWGIDGELPNDHPYKNSSPKTSNLFFVTDVDLTGAEVIDPDGYSSTVTWSVVSTSPSGLEANVTFNNPNALNAIATFTAEGVYTLRMTANDGFSTSSDEVVITVGPAMTSYNNWATGTFNQTFTDTDPNSDPDGDGMVNFMEFAFGMDPTTSSRSSLMYVAGGNVTQPGSPKLINFAAEGEAPDYRAVFLRRKDHIAAGLVYTIDFSADLGEWTTSGVTPTILTASESSGDMEAVSIPYPATVPAHGGSQNLPPLFFRVKIDMP